MDFPTELLQTVGRMIVDFKPKIFGNFVTFLFVEAKNDIKVLLESADELESTCYIFSRSLFGICQINKEFASWPLQTRAHLFQHCRPNITHRSEHGPVDKSDEVGTAEAGVE